MDFSDQTITELQALLDEANIGDDTAFNELLSRCESRMRGLVRRMLRRFPHVKRWEETDDVLQKSMIRLHRSIDETRPDSVRGFVGLAATQIRRTLIDLARHYYGVYGHGARHHSDGQGRAADDPGGALDRVARSVTESLSLDDWTTFHEASSDLPDPEREVFELVWYAGLPQIEIAKIIGVSQRTVVRRLNNARLLLRQVLYVRRSREQ